MRPYLTFATVSRPLELRWTEDGRILFLRDQRGESKLFEIPASGGRCRQVAGGGWQSSSISIDENVQAAVVLSSYSWSPNELYYLDLVSTVNEQLSHYSDEYLTNHPPAWKNSLSSGKDYNWTAGCGCLRGLTAAGSTLWCWIYTVGPTALFTIPSRHCNRSWLLQVTWSWRSILGGLRPTAKIS